jgi:hypothetical protein
VWKDVDTLEISGVTGTLEPLVSASIALHSYCDAHYLLPGSTLKQVRVLKRPCQGEELPSLSTLACL